ncbi:MAG: glycosyltransferase family 39 protein, partial [Desulfomonile tiedjei]|nr:glycosyltransferase family 39 protein [Desulfomonile tiedjei]
MDENRSGVAKSLNPCARTSILGDAAHLLMLISLWVVFVLIVNPCGEFMVNDDWAFTKALENLVTHGSLGSTGWGPGWAPGGPSLIAHLLWARLFIELFGFSLTVLRISVLFLGILASLGFWLLLRFSGNSRAVCFVATLTLILNPLFFSQCFTFMTDITFLSFAIFSMLFIFI